MIDKFKKSSTDRLIRYVKIATRILKTRGIHIHV